MPVSAARRSRKLPVTVILGVWWAACLLWSAGWLFPKWMALVQPLVAALLSALILDERFGVFAAIGGACILASAAVILRKDAAV